MAVSAEVVAIAIPVLSASGILISIKVWEREREGGDRE